MDPFLVNLEALTQETLKLSDSSSEGPKEVVATFPESIGVVYKIEKDEGTFCLRGWPSSNIRKDVLSLCDGDINFAKILEVKCSDDLDLGQIMFFGTNSFDLAEAIVDEMVNRHFPLKEESLMAPYWFMSFSDTRLIIYFNFPETERYDQLVQLGPIGDKNVATHCFQAFQKTFSSWGSQVDVVNFYCKKNFLELFCPNGSVFFEAFKNLFLKGEYPKKGTFPFEILGRTLSYFLKETAAVRKFWIEVDRKLTNL